MKIFMLLLCLLFGLNAYSGEFIVKMKAPSRAMSLFDWQRSELEMRSTRSLAGGMAILVSGDEDAIKANPFVEYAEPNFQVHVLGQSVSALPRVDAKAWGVNKVQAPAVWKQGITGKGVLIAVIDTGVDYNHPALKGKVIKGYDFANHDEDPMDDHEHGTHVSGTIVGKLIGVAPDAKILAIKFLDHNGSGSLADAVDSIHYATEHGAQIESNSWGGGGYSQALYDVIKEANDKGILFLAAAGNEANNNDVKPSYPASYELPNVIAVAATDPNDKMAFFSNYGKKTVHIAAPGTKIYSSVPNGKYDYMSGTSMATPHASGVAALMLSDEMSADQIKERMVESSDLSGLRVVSQGRINVKKALFSK